MIDLSKLNTIFKKYEFCDDKIIEYTRLGGKSAVVAILIEDVWYIYNNRFKLACLLQSLGYKTKVNGKLVWENGGKSYYSSEIFWM